MCKWVFPPNNNAVINGINDAGIATFASTMYDSLVRESIQNSLDAKADWADGPVEVHFTQENIPRNKIPGYESLSEALKKCEVVESNNELTRNFFKTAYETLDFNSINVLKISDYNTTGLKGSSSGKSGTAWSRLVKESGTNDKDGVAGGSFGIGKSAYFACSRFRTVFFSSLSEDNEKSNIGVARLISFDLDNETKSIGMGFYAEGNKLLAIQDLADFDGKPKRTEYGTDAPRPPPFWNCAAKMRHARIGNRKRRPPEAPSRPCPARTGAGAVPPKRCCAAGARRGAYNR